MHVSWVKESEFENDRFTKQKLINFQRKQGAEATLTTDDEYFDPDYLVIDRIIAKYEQKVKGTVNVSYFVKWKALPYEDCTWEDAADITVRNSRKLELTRFH